jgi:hypothetical protein
VSEEVLADLEVALDKAFACEDQLDIARLGQIVERVQCLQVRQLGRYRREGEWRAEGFISAAGAIRSACRMSHGRVAAALNLDAKLEQLPETAAAFASGAISRQHAEAIVDACTTERIDAIRDVEAELVEFARHSNPRELRAVVRRLADSIDGDQGAGSDEEQLARRRLHASVTSGGMVACDGMFDPESGEIYLTALRAEMEADRREGDTRTAEQRRADALINILRRTLDAGLITGTGVVRPHMTIVADLAELEARGGPAVVALARADAAHVGRLSTATLRRIACDCGISRVITDGRSAVIDVGRTTRTISPALRRALLVRDRHCQGNGCTRPGAWCDAHHIQHWIDGGRTNLENTKLLCRRCHTEAHLDASVRPERCGRPATPAARGSSP